jgi:hypothetical protein
VIPVGAEEAPSSVHPLVVEGVNVHLHEPNDESNKIPELGPEVRSQFVIT